MTNFQETKDRFLAATRMLVCYPITWDAWMTLDDGLKAAALFVNFYKEVTMAYNALKCYYLDEEDAVSHVCQYFCKNVDKIKKDKKRFANAYIYRVAYNSIFGFVRVPSRKDFADNTTSQYFSMDGEEHDIFEIIEDNTDCFSNGEFTKILGNLSDEQKSMVSHLIWGSRLKKAEQRREGEILDSLKKAFASLYENDDAEPETNTENTVTAKSHRKVTFGDIYEMDDEVKSAVCTMSDGEQAVYYGETHISHEGQIKVVFFGAKRDYFVPLDIAKMLEVNDVEMY